MALPTLPTPGISTGWGVTINAYMDALRVQLAEPAGIIKAYGGTTLPSNTAWCDGAAVARVGTHANLFAAIGTRYGAGDGSTTFNLPNLKGRTPVGIDAAQTEFAGASAAAMVGGGKTATIDTTQMPGHTHDITHGHSFSGGTATTATSTSAPYRTVQGSGANLIGVVGWPLVVVMGNGAVSGSVGAFSGATGSAGNGASPAHNNLQPYGLVNYIVTLGNP